MSNLTYKLGHKLCRSAQGLIIILLATFLSVVSAADDKVPLRYEDSEVTMRIVIRSPDQLSAFYQGRGFNQDAINEVLKTCYITPLIKNKKYKVLWLELDNWKFTVNGKSIPRIKRDYWRKKWRDIGLSQAHQSTFGWTLMPESRDLRLDEGVGGSVVIPMQSQPFNLTAIFKTGHNKMGKTKTITFKDITCVTGGSSPKR